MVHKIKKSDNRDQSLSSCYRSKKLMTSSQLLVQFYPEKELILSCNASQYGIGAVLAHHMADGTEKPIEFASKTITAAEKNYSQIEREGLACVFGIKKFHYGVNGLIN